MAKLVITGVDTPLGRQVARLVAQDAQVEVVGLAAGPVVDLPDTVRGPPRRPRPRRREAPARARRRRPPPRRRRCPPRRPRRPTTWRWPGACSTPPATSGVDHVVVLSSATVYGAWANNPVPLTEDAALRPNPGVPFAAERAEIERLTAEWRDAHPGATRRDPAAGASPPRTTRSRARLAGPGPAPGARGPRDGGRAAGAVRRPRRRRRRGRRWRGAERLDGAFNVAPDGSIPGDEVRSLIGVPPKVPLPERIAGRVLRLGVPLGHRADAARAACRTRCTRGWSRPTACAAEGWAATVSNEEACVEAHEAGPWATLSPRRRQEIALGVAGVGLVGVVVGAVVARAPARASRGRRLNRAAAGRVAGVRVRGWPVAWSTDASSRRISNVVVEPSSRATVTSTRSPGAYARSRRSRSAMSATSSPSSATTTSPGRMPPSAAGLSWTTDATSVPSVGRIVGRRLGALDAQPAVPGHAVGRAGRSPPGRPRRSARRTTPSPSATAVVMPSTAPRASVTGPPSAAGVGVARDLDAVERVAERADEPFGRRPPPRRQWWCRGRRPPGRSPCRRRPGRRSWRARWGCSRRRPGRAPRGRWSGRPR